jgi:GcrA cell cycle regulator
MSWTDEKVEKLKKMWLIDGFSATAIAQKLGGVSRSAVSGKIDRLGLNGKRNVHLIKSRTTRLNKSKQQLLTQAEEETKNKILSDKIKQEQLFVTLWEQGVTGLEIAGQLGISSSSVNNWRKRLGLKPRKQHGTADNKINKSDFAIKKISLLESNEKTCKWPIGDPTTEDFYYCGNDSLPKKSYCSYHYNESCGPKNK